MRIFPADIFQRGLKAGVVRLSVALIAAGLAGCRPAADTDQTDAPKVTDEAITFSTNSPQLASIAVETAKTGDPENPGFFGRLTWNGDATANIFSPVAGRVLKIRVRLNEPVAAGDVLAEVDSPDYSQALADARTAEGNFAAADKANDRARELLAHGAAAQKDVESAEAVYVAARAEVERAKARLANYGGSVDGAGGVYLLKSPLSGVVVDRNLSPGQEIRADMMLANASQFFTPLFVVSDPQRLWVQLDIPENELHELKPGLPFVIRSQAWPEETFTGSVQVVSSALDPTTRTVTVRGSIDNPDGRLKAEMLVTVRFPSTGAPKLQVPARAVFLKGNRHCLFVREQPGVFRRREVTVGETADDTVEIMEGLNPGDVVVVDGALLLEELLE